MSCGCKNKEYHPCQNGGECKCGGKCKKQSYSNAVGSIDEFKKEDKNVGKLVFQLAGGIALALIALIVYSKIKKETI